MLGEPLYWLRSTFADGAEFEALSPMQVVHYLAVVSGEHDDVDFVLRATHTGVTEFWAHVSFEVHIGYPGPAYWSGCVSGPVTVTVLAAPTATPTPGPRQGYLPVVFR